MSTHCKQVILILALTLGSQAYAAEIIGGHEAVPHSRPYMVLLEEHKQNGETKYCDGFLLNQDFVMTAAHCEAQSYTVLLGVHNIHSKDKQNISVEQAFPHKDYDNKNFKNDIMLLKLSSKVTFNNNVKPIALASQSGSSLPKSCIVSGWGRTKGSKYMSDVLMEVEVKLIDDKQCAAENMYCSEGETGPSLGDSGGPLVCEDGKAYGVVSFNINPSPDGPQITAYAKIPDHQSWIDQTIKYA